MKRIKNILCYNILILFFGYVGLCNSQNLNKKYSWKYSVNEHCTIELENYNCDIEITKGESKKVEFELEVVATDGSEEDVLKLDGYLTNLEFKASSDKIDLYTVFWKKLVQVTLFTGYKSSIVLKNNEEIRFKKIEQKAYLKIPETIYLKLFTKYSDILIPNLERLKLDSYKDNIVASNILMPSTIDAKYSDMEFKNISDCKLDIYNCDLEFITVGDIVIRSKYSEFIADKIGNLKVDSYDDKYKFNQTGNVNFVGKYSDFESTNSGNLEIGSYKCNFESVNIKEIEVAYSKYSSYKFSKSINISCASSYDDEFIISGTGQVKIYDSKYSRYEFSILDQSFLLAEGYKDNIDINNTSENFSYIDINGKYHDIDVGVNKDLPLKLDIDVKYGELDYNEDTFNSKSLIKENSDYKLNAFRGEGKNNMPYIKLRGYKNELTIEDLTPVQ